MRRLLTTVLAVVTVGLLMAPAVGAGQEKVEVCHLEGTGEFHLIAVADPSFDAHVAHGDGTPGGDVPGVPGYVFDEACETVEAMPDVTLRLELVGSIGNTTAHAGGLTYDFLGNVFTDPNLVYTEALWGVYELYLPGDWVQLNAIVENLGDAATGRLWFIFGGSTLNLDGSRGSPIIIPPIRNVVDIPPPGSYAVVPFSFILPSNFKALNVLDIEMYLGDPADGVLLAQESVVFCPPELN